MPNPLGLAWLAVPTAIWWWAWQTLLLFRLLRNTEPWRCRTGFPIWYGSVMLQARIYSQHRKGKA